MRANDPDIRLRMIDVADLEWTIPVAGRALFEFPEKRLHLIGSAAALPFLPQFPTNQSDNG